MCKYKSESRPDYECKKPPWEKSKEGYCIFHEPGKDKDIELFDAELRKEKLDQQDYEFVGYVFPGDTPYFRQYKFESNVDFTEAVFLGDSTDLSWAEFSGNMTEFVNAQFSGDTTNFTGAKFTGAMTDFSGLELSGDRTYFSGVRFSGGRPDFSSLSLRGVDFIGADLSGANLRDVDLREAILFGANLENADVRDVKYNRRGKYRGIRVATCYGSPSFKRFAQDQDFLEELQSTRKGKVIYWIWEVLADCGRPPGLALWFGWSMFLAFLFALVYCYHLGPSAFEFGSDIPENFRTFLYYSVVTFTTLGFGDVTPETNYASYFVMAEVFLGYVMLGGLISIFATMLARRS